MGDTSQLGRVIMLKPDDLTLDVFAVTIRGVGRFQLAPAARCRQIGVRLGGIVRYDADPVLGGEQCGQRIIGARIG